MKDDIFPVGLKLDGLECVVVGSSDETWARAAVLVNAGARVRAISEHPPKNLSEAARRGSVALETREFASSDLDHASLVVLTDMNDSLAERIASAAKERRVFFCAVDQPEHSTFSHLAISRSGPLMVAISTGGKAPALARKLREELDRLFAGVDIPAFVERLAALRERTPRGDRRQVLGAAVDGVKIAGHIELGDDVISTEE